MIKVIVLLSRRNDMSREGPRSVRFRPGPLRVWRILAMNDQTLLWIGCGGCSGQAILGVEGQVSRPARPARRKRAASVVASVVERTRTVVCLLRHNGRPRTADRALHRGIDCAGRRRNVRHGRGHRRKYRIVRALCDRADYVIAMGVCAAFGGWQAQSPIRAARSACNSPWTPRAGCCRPSGSLGPVSRWSG